MADGPLAAWLAGELAPRGFAVVRRLSGTGTCTVYCVAEHGEASGELFAAKVVGMSGLDAMGRASAQQEVSFLKGIKTHPNLISYRDSFLAETRLVIVMSLAEDGDLRGVVKESIAAQRPIPEPVVLSWMRQTLSGLDHMHNLSVLHRDLKSSNIFLSGGRRSLQIGDFGISRVLESTRFAESQVGTPAYMSPELMQHQRYDYKVDMWATGVVCYELCTLNMPFHAASLLDIFVQVTEAEPDWDRWAGLSEELCDVTRCLLQKEPDLRPSAADLLAEPVFAEAVLAVPEELWAVVAPPEVPTIVKAHSGLQKTSMSVCSTTVGSNAISPSTTSFMMTEKAISLKVEDFHEMMNALDEDGELPQPPLATEAAAA